MGCIGNTSAWRLCRIRTIKYYYNSEHEGFKPLPSPWNRHSILSSFSKYALISEIIKQVCCKSLRELHLQCQNNRWRWRQRSARPEYKIHVTLCKHRAGESGLQPAEHWKHEMRPDKTKWKMVTSQYWKIIMMAIQLNLHCPVYFILLRQTYRCFCPY